jgi:hypothetical protein
LRYTGGMSMFRLSIWIVLSLVLASNNAKADKVDQYCDTISKNFNVPGLSLAMVKDGKVASYQSSKQ